MALGNGVPYNLYIKAQFLFNIPLLMTNLAVLTIFLRDTKFFRIHTLLLTFAQKQYSPLQIHLLAKCLQLVFLIVFHIAQNETAIDCNKARNGWRLPNSGLFRNMKHYIPI